MKRIILGVLYASILIPCMMLGSYGPKAFIPIAILTFFLTVINAIFTDSRKEYLIGYFLILVSSSAGIIINGYLYYKSVQGKGIWGNLQGDLVYEVATVAHIMFFLILMAVEFKIKQKLSQRSI